MKLILQILIILMLFGSIPSAIYQGKVIAYPDSKASYYNRTWECWQYESVEEEECE